MIIPLTLFINHEQITIEVEYDEGKLDLSNRNITSIKDTVFPQSLTVLDISGNQITSLEGLPPSLTVLDISRNQIKSLEGLPPSLTELYIYNNQIKSLEGLPPSLTELYIWNNQITSLVSPQGEMFLPPSLTVLDISRNQIKSLEGLPQSLTVLKIWNNQIKSLEGLPPSLTELYIWNNQITSLEGLPQSLTELYISRNRITSLEGLPQSLTELNISSNQIKTLPIELVHLRNLRNFYYGGNEIENIHPSVQRFIENLENRDARQGNTVYDDRQNVHNLTVQNSIRDSLNKLTTYTQTIIKSKLSDEEISFLDDQEVHSFFHFTQKEVLLFVENAIVINKNDEIKNELYSLLREALREGRNVCSTGRIGRMVNVLSGFDPNVQIKISDKAQIGAIVSSFKERNEPKERVAEELRNRGIEKEEIDLWLEYY
jgi:Leucine-rich repeat (LRR) protein